MAALASKRAATRSSAKQAQWEASARATRRVDVGAGRSIDHKGTPKGDRMEERGGDGAYLGAQAAGVACRHEDIQGRGAAIGRMLLALHQTVECQAKC